MLPLSLLKAAESHPMLIELKNGDTYNGRLVSCNMFMNVFLRDVICTSKVSFPLVIFPLHVIEPNDTITVFFRMETDFGNFLSAIFEETA